MLYLDTYDKELRFQMCKALRAQLAADETLRDRWVFSDESAFRRYPGYASELQFKGKRREVASHYTVCETVMVWAAINAKHGVVCASKCLPKTKKFMRL